jgi:hypothetical protein
MNENRLIVPNNTLQATAGNGPFGWIAAARVARRA